MENLKTIFGTVLAVTVMFVVGGIFLFFPQGETNALSADDFLRIHIRANSNSEVDQNIKYQVKDEVVKVLTPLFANITTKEEAIKTVGNNLGLIEDTANNVLHCNGFAYKSEAKLQKEYFPTRTYDGVTLESDVYDAIILNLGAGKGDNWWCVAFPPMCFVGGEGDDSSVVYRSKLLEIIKNFFWHKT